MSSGLLYYISYFTLCFDFGTLSALSPYDTFVYAVILDP